VFASNVLGDGPTSEPIPLEFKFSKLNLLGLDKQAIQY
jgi:hypothetical protein